MPTVTPAKRCSQKTSVRQNSHPAKLHPLTRSTGPDYTARPGSRAPDVHEVRRTMPTGAYVGPIPDWKFVGRSSAARICRFRTFRCHSDHDSLVLPDPMTALTHHPIGRPRLAGQRRLAASRRAPIGAMGSGAQPPVDPPVAKRGMRMASRATRKQQMCEVTFSRTSGFGYRSLDAGHSGAGSDPGSGGTRHSASTRSSGSERFDTPRLRHVPGGAFSFHRSCSRDARTTNTRPSAPSARTKSWPLFDNRWPGKKHAVLGQHVERRRPA